MKKFSDFVSAMHESETTAKTELQKSYQDYFSAKLNKLGAKTLADLTTEQKTILFNEVNEEWERGQSKKKSQVNEAEVKSDDDFKEYANTVLKKAFGDKFDQEKADKTANGILKKAKGDYGAAVGMLTAGLGESQVNEAQQADLVVPANDASDMEEECEYIVELLKKAGVNAGCEAGLGEIEVYLKSKGDLAKAKKALEKNALEYTANEAEVSEGKMEGSGRMAAYQMENANNGLRADSVFINTDRYGSKNTMNIKISMYSGGSDGINFNMPKKLAELNDKVSAGFRSKEPQALTDAENSDREKAILMEQMQGEIFAAVAKEMDAFDKKLGAIVAGIVKKY